MIIGHLKNKNIIIKLEATDKFPTESSVYHALKLKLIEMGFDCIKKLMWKDGHLVDSDKYYVRQRAGNWAVTYEMHHQYALHQDLKKSGFVELTMNNLSNDITFDVPSIGNEYKYNGVLRQIEEVANV